MTAPFTSDSIVPIWIALGVSGVAMLVCAIHFVVQKCVQRKKEKEQK